MLKGLDSYQCDLSLPWHVHSSVQHKLFWLHAQLFVQRIILMHEQMRPSRSSDAIGQETVFHFFLSHPCSSGEQMFGLVTCDDFHTFVCHWARLASSSKLALHGGSFANDVFILLTSFNHKRLRLEWAFFSKPWNGLPTPFASQRWKLFSSHFKTRRNPSPILLVSALQDLRCRNAPRQPWLLTRQAALPRLHTRIGADINGHGTQGKLKPTYFKMFLKVSDDVINIRDKEGQSEEESHLADEFWI